MVLIRDMDDPTGDGEAAQERTHECMVMELWLHMVWGSILVVQGGIWGPSTWVANNLHGRLLLFSFDVQAYTHG